MSEFDKAYETYDINAIQQKNIADKLFDFINKNYQINDFIIDIGCGTGFLGKNFLQTGKNVCFSDISDNMLNECKKKIINSNATFEKIDFNDYDSLQKSILNKVAISSMSLQWSVDFFKTLDIISKNSKLFAFSIPIAGSFKEWHNLLDKYNISIDKFNFKTTDEILSFFKNKNIKYQVISDSLVFDNIKLLLKNFKGIGINYKCLESIHNVRKLLQDTNKITSTYKVLNLIFNQ